MAVGAAWMRKVCSSCNQQPADEMTLFFQQKGDKKVKGRQSCYFSQPFVRKGKEEGRQKER